MAKGGEWRVERWRGGERPEGEGEGGRRQGGRGGRRGGRRRRKERRRSAGCRERRGGVLSVCPCRHVCRQHLSCVHPAPVSPSSLSIAGHAPLGWTCADEADDHRAARRAPRARSESAACRPQRRCCAGGGRGHAGLDQRLPSVAPSESTDSAAVRGFNFTDVLAPADGLPGPHRRIRARYSDFAICSCGGISQICQWYRVCDAGALRAEPLGHPLYLARS